MNLLPAKCDRTTNRWSAREIGEVFNEPLFVPFFFFAPEFSFVHGLYRNARESGKKP